MSGIIMPTDCCGQILQEAITAPASMMGHAFWNHRSFWLWTLAIIGFALGLYWASSAFGAGSIPGSDASDKLEAAGTLLRILDTALFKWGARIFAGICIMSSAWSLKEQRFGIAIICIVGALIFGTAPTWVRNIFSIGTNASVFEQ